MVVDTLDNLEKYVSLNPLFTEVVNFLKNHSLDQLELGRIELKGEDLFMNVVQTAPKAKEEAKLEAHRDYIDIQIPLTATEYIGYQPLSECQPADAVYNAEQDIVFFDGLAHTYLTMNPGMFAIFFPQDGHAPAISEQGVKKIIIKVKA